MTRRHDAASERWLSVATWLLPAGVSLLLAWSYLDSFLRPSFFGDAGVRLDRAGELVVGVGRRVWLPSSSSTSTCSTGPAPPASPSCSFPTPTPF
jgi:hypothetical protein